MHPRHFRVTALMMMVMMRSCRPPWRTTHTHLYPCCSPWHTTHTHVGNCPYPLLALGCIQVQCSSRVRCGGLCLSDVRRPSRLRFVPRCKAFDVLAAAAVNWLAAPLACNWLFTLVVVLIIVMLCARCIRGTVHLPIPPHTRLWVGSVELHDIRNAAHELYRMVWGMDVVRE